MTTLSPLQFQKTLRLYEAQRLMLTSEYDVANAAYAVGYESSTAVYPRVQTDVW